MSESPSAKPTLRESMKLQFRTAILNAALEVFSESGYQAAQIREIADRAGVAVGTIYNLFENKEGLYRSIIRDHGLDMAAEFSELFRSSEDELTILRRYIELKGELLSRKESPLRLFFSVALPARLSVRHGLDSEHQRLYQTLLLELADVFQRAMEKGVLQSEAGPFDLAVALDGMTNAFAILSMDHPGQHDYARKAPALFNMFFGALVSKAELDRIAAGQAPAAKGSSE